MLDRRGGASKRLALALKELPSYVWDETQGKPKDVPVKENDHGQDAKRYIVVERDAGGRPRVRFIGG